MPQTVMSHGKNSQSNLLRVQAMREHVICGEFKNNTETN